MRILIAAGGTVGHVAPALAVADELRARGAEVTFAGTPNRIEAEVIPARGYPFLPFEVSGFPRAASLQLVKAVGKAVVAPFSCSGIIKQVRPDAVFGAGGYVAGPMLAAARHHRLPSALSEADARIGRISYNSPLGRALISRRVSDEIEVTVPAGDRSYLVEKIEFI